MFWRVYLFLLIESQPKFCLKLYCLQNFFIYSFIFSVLYIGYSSLQKFNWDNYTNRLQWFYNNLHGLNLRDICWLLILTLCVCVFQSLHTKVVHQYQHHYRDGPPTSGDEECLYWIRFLTYHMAKANLSQVTLTHKCFRRFLKAVFKETHAEIHFTHFYCLNL